jgi:hypothetical protein
MGRAMQEHGGEVKASPDCARLCASAGSVGPLDAAMCFVPMVAGVISQRQADPGKAPLKVAARALPHRVAVGIECQFEQLSASLALCGRITGMHGPDSAEVGSEVGHDGVSFVRSTSSSQWQRYGSNARRSMLTNFVSCQQRILTHGQGMPRVTANFCGALFVMPSDVMRHPPRNPRYTHTTAR